MINVQRKTLSIFLVLFSLIGLSACGTVSSVKGALTERGKINYQNNQAIKQLEVPPDLTDPEFDKSFDLPTGVVSAVSLNNGGSGALTSNNSGAVNATTGTTAPKVAALRGGDLSSIRSIGGQTVLQVNDTYPRSLIITEIMLTRMGFSTLSKSSTGDLITAKYNGAPVSVDGKRKGLFSRAKSLINLGRDNKALISGEKYRITIKNEQGVPIVRFARANAKSISNAAHAKIIERLNAAFNR